MSHIQSILALSIISAVLLVVCRVFYNIFLHPLRHYPGPRWWAATRLPWAHSLQSGLYHLKLHELHNQYGPVVRVAPDELSYINAEAWKGIYGNRIITRNRVWASQEEEDHPMSIMSADEPTHLRNRRAVAGAFTEHAIMEHDPLLTGLVETMVQKFNEEIARGQGRAVIDLTAWLNWLTFDISGALSFGEAFGSVENGREHPWVEISCGFGKGIALMASINFFSPMNKLLKLCMPRETMEKMKYHRELVHDKLMQRLTMKTKAKAQDYVGSIISYNEEKGETKIPKEEVEANMTVLIFAGSETTSTAMTSIISHLLQNRAALEKLRNAVRAAYTTEAEITIASVAKLDYLTAVVQEGIRMGPPAAIGMPRVTPRDGEVICGHYVPGNTFVAVNQYPAFRSASNFNDPNSFVPERFLPNSPYPSDRMDAFEPFLLGRHKCIGQKLAWATMRLTLARLFFAFDMEPLEHIHDFGKQKTYLTWKKQPLKLCLQVRGC